MSGRTKRLVEPFIENAAEATTACLLTMVQGNLLAITLSHWLIASQTGIASGAATAAVLFLWSTTRPWKVALVFGVLTAIADFFVHPGQFGPVALEAMVTGAGAAVLSWLVGSAYRWMRRWRAAA
jgi:hypothetical protein